MVKRDDVTDRPSKDMIRREIEWENKMVTEGIARYRSTLIDETEHKDGTVSYKPAALANTQAGTKITADVVNSIIGPISELKERCLEHLAGQGKGVNKEDWMYQLVQLDADVLAVITARGVFTSVTTSLDERWWGVPAISVVKAIAGAVLDQITFEQWKQDQGESEGPDMAKIILSRYKGNPNRMFVRRMRMKFQDMRTAELSNEQRIKLGCQLLRIAIEHGGGWTVQRTVYNKGKPQLRVGLTAEAEAWLIEQHIYLELAMPMLRPMLIPPRSLADQIHPKNQGVS